MKKFDIDADNKITGEKENSNSEKVCLDGVKLLYGRTQQKLESNLG